jgi:hypothetical protein
MACLAVMGAGITQSSINCVIPLLRLPKPSVAGSNLISRSRDQTKIIPDTQLETLAQCPRQAARASFTAGRTRTPRRSRSVSIHSDASPAVRAFCINIPDAIISDNPNQTRIGPWKINHYTGRGTSSPFILLYKRPHGQRPHTERRSAFRFPAAGLC